MEQTLAMVFGVSLSPGIATFIVIQKGQVQLEII